MKISLPKHITKELPMSLYAEGAEGVITVWVNPPNEFTTRYTDIYAEQGKLEKEFSGKKKLTDAEKTALAEERDSMAKERIAKVYEWCSELWSKGPEDTHISVDDLVIMREETKNTDPQILRWLISESLDMIYEHQVVQKKR